MTFNIRGYPPIVGRCLMRIMGPFGDNWIVPSLTASEIIDPIFEVIDGPSSRNPISLDVF